MRLAPLFYFFFFDMQCISSRLGDMTLLVGMQNEMTEVPRRSNPSPVPTAYGLIAFSFYLQCSMDILRHTSFCSVFLLFSSVVAV